MAKLEIYCYDYYNSISNKTTFIYGHAFEMINYNMPYNLDPQTKVLVKRSGSMAGLGVLKRQFHGRNRQMTHRWIHMARNMP